MNITHYKTLVFDCDGVVLDSNKVKTNAFYKAALPYGETAAQRLVSYHVEHGGISRYKKFEWFLQEVVASPKESEMQQLLNAYANEVRHGLLTCDITPELQEFRNKTTGAKWMIVSGGDQMELRDVFRERELDTFFDGGIFGSPDNKDEILHREITNNNIELPALFLGDSRYDHTAASGAKLDFVFLTAWSEFHSWPEYCSLNKIKTVKSIMHMI